MPAARAPALALLVLLPACFLLGDEEDAAAAPDCRVDRDCDETIGAWCDAGRCVVPAGCDEAVPTNPELVRDECHSSLECVPEGTKREDAELARTIYSDDGSLSPGANDLCVIARRTPHSCLSTTHCADARDEGRPGGFACAEDLECASGLCLPLGLSDEEDHAASTAPGLCAQLCDDNGDCAGRADIFRGVRIGLECRAVRLDHRFVQLCVPSPTTPDATICALDDDCPEGQACRFELIAADREEDGRPWYTQLPLCGPPNAGGAPMGQLCSDAASCEDGRCTHVTSVDSALNAENLSWADSGSGSPDALRCDAPCRQVVDCPAPYTCREGGSFEAVGEPVLVQGSGEHPITVGLAVPRCMLPVGGCIDLPNCLGFEERRDVDPSCCSFDLQPDRGSCNCTAATELERRGLRCRLFPNVDRLERACSPPPPNTLPLGACCATSASCETNLCVEARPDRPHPDGCEKFCSTPCDELPGQDRCAWFAPGGTYADEVTPYPGAPGIDHVEWFAQARCERLPWDGPGTPEIPACR